MSSSDPQHALTLESLRLTFHPGSPDERVALDGLSLQMDEGDFAVVIGSNGAGKSTLLNVIAGALPPDSGRVVFDGKDVTALAVHRRAAYIGRVFQDPMLGTAPALSIEENLALAQRRGQHRHLAYPLPGRVSLSPTGFHWRSLVELVHLERFGYPAVVALFFFSMERQRFKPRQ